MKRIIRPLQRYFTDSSLDKIVKEKYDMTPLRKINKKILKSQIKVNTIIEKYIKLIKSNSSKHKQYLVKLNLDDAERDLKELREDKEVILRFIMNNI
tara:strand:+ start:2025 stop:2315 length:291 start_codon:yes stop_codon:yes gene_type:complete